MWCHMPCRCAVLAGPLRFCWLHVANAVPACAAVRDQKVSRGDGAPAARTARIQSRTGRAGRPHMGPAALCVPSRRTL